MTVLIKLTLFAVAVMAMVNSQRVMDASRDMPPNLPWVPTWVECDFDFVTYNNGPVCNDCYSSLHCTPSGGVLRNCFGWTPYCVEGKCAKEPSAECSEVETVTHIYVNGE